MAKRQEVFVQFLYKGDREDLERVVDSIGVTLWDLYGIDSYSVKVETLDEDAN